MSEPRRADDNEPAEPVGKPKRSPGWFDVYFPHDKRDWQMVILGLPAGVVLLLIFMSVFDLLT